MARVIIKLGGGLITDKTRYKVVLRDRIDAVSEVISMIIDMGHSVIVIHGAGSFGHIEAKKWDISEGLKSEIAEQQISAIDTCLLYTSPSPRDRQKSRMPSSA